jgi:tetratricopeptide (TPR) repeat protein
MWGTVMERPDGGMQTLATPFVLRVYSPFVKLIVRRPIESVAADTATSESFQPDPRRHVVQFSFKRAFAVVALGSLATLAVAAQAPAQAPAQDAAKAAAPAQTKQWKDRAEYDLSDSIIKEQNATTKLQLLKTWKEKYPTSDFKVDRQLQVMDAYRLLGNGKEMLAAAKDVIDLDPKNIQGLYWANLLTVSLQDKSPEALAAGEKYAKGLIEATPDFFDAAKKPPAVAEDAWKKERSNMETIAHRTLGWIAMQKKQNEDAEKEFQIVLQSNPNDAEASYWDGTVVAMQRKLEKQSAALYHFAHAAYHDGQGALPDATRKPLQAYLEKTYINFHGDKTGLDTLIEATKKDPLPPAGFHIESKDEALEKQQKELETSNPPLALWVKIKGELSGANGQQYFDTSLKGAAVPPPEGINGVKKFKGWVVGTAPEKKPTSVIVGISGKEMSEVTLKFEKPLGAIPEKGLEIEFSGAPSAFDPDTKMLTFDVEPDDVSGLPKPAAPAKKAAAPAKKAAAPKK